MQKILFVGIGGFIGAIARYLITLNTQKLITSQLPYGTLLVNVLGGFLIGVIMELSLNTNMSPNLKLLLTTGILGGLTTFSTFSHETISLFYAGNYLYGLLNVALNLVLSFGGVVIGKELISFIY